MKIALESGRFALIFLMFFTILSGMFYILLSSLQLQPASFEWLAIFGAIGLTYLLYRRKGWGEVFHKRTLILAIFSMLLLTLLIPDMTPTEISAHNQAYTYGFPFRFLTLYVDGGSPFLLMNLFSKQLVSWSIDITFVLNTILLYILYKPFN